jgi:hypothetical protein
MSARMTAVPQLCLLLHRHAGPDTGGAPRLMKQVGSNPVGVSDTTGKG